MADPSLPPAWRRTSIEVPCDLDRAWWLLTDVEQWPRWGPTVNAASFDGPFVDGTPGTVTTLAGVRLPVVLEDVVARERWAWRVAGVPATSHHVTPVTGGGTLVTIGVPAWAVPYLVVCRIGLRRLRAIA